MSDATTIDAMHLDPPDAPAGDGIAYLVVRQGDRTQVIDLAEGNEVLIGRGAEATVQLDDAKASREHARVRRRDGALWLRDLGSRNGTRINQDTLKGEERRIGSGDLIRIGDAEIVVAETSGSVRAQGAGASGGRLGSELERLAASGGRATLVRILVDPAHGAATLAELAPALGGAALVEAQGSGEYACLLVDEPAAALKVVDELRRAAPQASIAAVRFPDDGKSAAELWQKARGAKPAAGHAVPSVDAPAGVVVADPEMQRVFQLVRKVAPTPTTVLILGETGVGKEVVAEQIHRQSPRAKGPFVRLNCGSLPETLLESELFGHERGAFTGADRRKVGHLEAADNGTLFLDEIGEMPLAMQAKLLRVIEGRRLMRVGGREEIAVDVRVLSATHRDLEAEAKGGRFREDLYFRLSAFILRIPPLRERPAEVALLAEVFARQFAQRMGVAAPVIQPAAAAALRNHRWPGNVRELRNAMEHAVVLAEDGRLEAEHLPDTFRREGSAQPAGAMREHLASVEQKAIEEALALEGGNQTRAARRLGISRRALIYKLEKYGFKK
jgi:DNA-binding NtrC family response regulator